MSPRGEMNHPGNFALKTVIEARAMWAIAPSCWNQTFPSCISSRSGSKKFLVMSTYRCELTVTARLSS
ncbi:hypothetical protein B7P43_G14580 [Cryptotermes secundus]|uniref:Uncharacterized protein n=1 Tax=Cryptotermes secundus TaxID=105785 RepID=A0A2J7PDZ5_9NEOP|nr:hypothetical protein B7P43_G14580 [Cryptotermes secundus]